MRVKCPECGVKVAAGSLLTHSKSQHIVGWGEGGVTPPPPPPPIMGRPITNKSPTQKRCCNSGARKWGAWVGCQTGPTYGFTLRIAMCRTKF